MALLATVPPPATLARSTSAYILAPALLDDGAAYLTIPRAFGRPALMARFAGDRLVVRRGRAARALFDGTCATAADCHAVAGPVGAATDVVYAVTAEDGGGGYVARAGADGRSRILLADETGRAPLVYATAGGRAVWVAGGAIVARDPAVDPAPVTVVAAADAGGVRGVAASAAGVAWLARASSRAPWTVHAFLGDAPADLASESRHGVRLGPPALGDDGTVAFARRVPVDGPTVRIEIVAIRPGDAGEVVIASSPDVPARDADPVPHVQIRGTHVLYRIRDGAAGRWEAIRATDVVDGTTVTFARLGRRAARLSDPVVLGDRVAWAQTDFRAGRFVRSRLLRVALAL